MYVSGRAWVGVCARMGVRVCEEGMGTVWHCGRPQSNAARSTATWWWCTKHIPEYDIIQAIHVCLPHWLLLLSHSVYPVGQASALRAGARATMVVTTSRKTSWERPDPRRILHKSKIWDTRDGARQAALPVCIYAGAWCINIRTTDREHRSFTREQKETTLW